MRKLSVAGLAPLIEGRCRVIAEAGVNHGNSVDRAIELAEAAARSNAWAVKYQFYKAETIARRDSAKYWNDNAASSTQFEAFAESSRLDYLDYRPVAERCSELGIGFFSTPFDLAAVDAMEELGCPIYKIASGDITFGPLLDRVKETGKPVLLSTGASTVSEVAAAVERLGGLGAPVVLLVCTLTYPTPDEDGNFQRIQSMRDSFPGHLVGFSDHTLGAIGGAMAGALGACCIEKHFTLDKTLTDVPDHAMSVDEGELHELVLLAERSAVLRGGPEIGPVESELRARVGARRSIVAGRDLPSGAVVELEDLAFLRPGDGMSPMIAAELVGRRLAHDVPRGRPLAPDDILDWPES